MRRWPNVGLLLAHRLGRWPDNKPTLRQRLMLAGLSNTSNLCSSIPLVGQKNISEKNWGRLYFIKKVRRKSPWKQIFKMTIFFIKMIDLCHPRWGKFLWRIAMLYTCTLLNNSTEPRTKSNFQKSWVGPDGSFDPVGARNESRPVYKLFKDTKCVVLSMVLCIINNPWYHSIRVGHSTDFGLLSVVILPWMGRMRCKAIFTFSHEKADIFIYLL